jgi:hypothetical protein
MGFHRRPGLSHAAKGCLTAEDRRGATPWTRRTVFAEREVGVLFSTESAGSPCQLELLRELPSRQTHDSILPSMAFSYHSRNFES